MISKLTKVVFSALIASLLIIGCQEASIPNSPDVSPTVKQDINTPPPGINFLKANINNKLLSGTLIASTSEYLLPGIGGTVGGEVTLNNFAEIPGDAFNVPTLFTVEVRQDNFLYVDFSPSLEFKKKVKITLNTLLLNISPEKLNKLKIYYFNPNTEQWEVVNGHYERTNTSVSVWVKHFSRYGFAE